MLDEGWWWWIRGGGYSREGMVFKIDQIVPNRPFDIEWRTLSLDNIFRGCRSHNPEWGEPAWLFLSLNLNLWTYQSDKKMLRVLKSLWSKYINFVQISIFRFSKKSFFARLRLHILCTWAVLIMCNKPKFPFFIILAKNVCKYSIREKIAWYLD